MPDFIPGFLQNKLFDNTYMEYLYSAFVFATALTALYFLKDICLKRLKLWAAKTTTDIDDLIINLISQIKLYEYQLVAFYLSVRHLNRPQWFDRALFIIILFIFTYRAVIICQQLLVYWIQKLAANRNLSGTAKNSVVSSSQAILKSALWIAAVLFILANLGFNISAVLTGLGIGGVAVALAAQAILGDLFNFFVILLDRPFTTGDFVTFDAFSGTIEHIGLKSTRVRSLSGELIIISNSNLLSSRIRNFKDLNRRRVVFKTLVDYQTGTEKLKKVAGIIKAAVEAQNGTQLDRANLLTTGDFAIEFETAYYINNGEYNIYMDTHEKILLAIKEAFDKEQIAFGYLRNLCRADSIGQK